MHLLYWGLIAIVVFGGYLLYRKLRISQGKRVLTYAEAFEKTQGLAPGTLNSEAAHATDAK